PLPFNLSHPPPPISSILFSLHSHRDHRHLHSFPTRRSSDLMLRQIQTSNQAMQQSGERLRLALEASLIGTWDWEASSARRNRSPDRKSTRLNSSHVEISYAVFCLKKKNHETCMTRPLAHQRE